MALGVDRIEVLEIQVERPGVNRSLAWNCAVCGLDKRVGELSQVTVRLEGDDLAIRDITACGPCLDELVAAG